MGRTTIHLLVRTAAFVAVDLAFAHLVHIPGDDGLGVGFLAFESYVVLAALWGALDGWLLPFGRLAVAWVGAGLLTGVVTALPTGHPGETLDWGLVLGTAVVVAPFTAALVTAPALVAGAVVVSLRGARTAD
jgi:hypothetical protein